MEGAYRKSLLKSFKKNIDGGYFPFLNILDIFGWSSNSLNRLESDFAVQLRREESEQKSGAPNMISRARSIAATVIRFGYF